MKRLLPFIFVFLSLLQNFNVSSQIPTSGLVAYYPFNGNTNDESGNGNNGLNYGCTFVSGQIGTCIQLTKGDHIDVPDNSILNPSQITLAFWVSLDSIVISGNQFLLTKGNDQTTGSYYISQNEKQQFDFYLGANPIDQVAVSSQTMSLQKKTWYHIAATYNGTEMKIYINGVLSGTSIATHIIGNSLPLFIGYQNLPSWEYYTMGRLDEIRIYNRALSVLEIEKLYNENNSNTITDIDGNVYDTVKIGTQVWMKENLKTTKFNDGTAIPNVTDNTTWLGLTTGAYCWYNNEIANKTTYGALYNWYTVNTGILCPAGWHVPGDNEWKQLEMYLGMNQTTADILDWRGTNEGGKLKETGLTHWQSPNTGATNESVFTGLPGGIRWSVSGTFGNSLTYNGTWWSSTQYNTAEALYRGLYWDRSTICRASDPKIYGFSVRCLKNDLTSGLVAYYPFNGNANDESGTGYNGTNNGATLTSDRFSNTDKAYTFNGSSNYIEIPTTALINLPQGTVSAFIRLDQINIQHTIVDKTVTNLISYFQFLIDNDNKLRAYVNSYSTFYKSQSTLSANKWYHVAVTWNGIKIKFYINGILDKEYDCRTSIPNISKTTFIGKADNNTAYFKGKLDDIRIYSRDFTNSEIISLYNENGWATLPSIASITPTSGPVGTSVTITGSNFSSNLTDNIVWFGAARGTVTAVTSTQLSVTVPSGATYQPVSVTVNGLTAYSAKPFNVTFNSAQVINASSFTVKNDFGTDSSPIYLAVSDFDTDGKPDLAVTNQYSNSISVLRNLSVPGSMSIGSFSGKVDFTTGSEPVGIAVGDFDGDGYPDIAVANNVSNTVSVFRNTGISGNISLTNFSLKVDFPVGSHPSGIAVGDIDGDGKPDIATANYATNSISILRNTSTTGTIDANSFAGNIDFTTGTTPENVLICDIDGDGKLDAVTTNYAGNSISVFRNTSTSGVIDNSTFAPKVDITTGTGPYNLTSGDFDRDGKIDIAVTIYNTNKVSVFRNISNTGSITAGSFASAVDYTSDTGEGIATGDIDGDGKPDLVVTNYTGGVVSVLRNKSNSGSIGFDSKVDFTAGTMPQGVAICDFDGDGKSDIAVSNSSTSSNTITVYRNTMVGTTAPSAPVVGTITQPTCTAPTGSVILSGLPATGTWTLTRSPGGITTNGNGSSTTISGLEPGTYTYTVTDSYSSTSAASSNIVINTPTGAPSTPTAGTIIQPTCLSPTGSITINGLPSGNWTLTRTPAGTTNGVTTTTTVTGLAPGTYSFTVTNSAGCTSAALGNVVIQAVPTGNVPVIEKKWNSVLICYNTDNVYSSWQWYRGTELVSTVTTKAYYNTNKVPGSYRVYTTDKDGCKNYSNSIDIVAGAKSISVYPNPAEGKITVGLADESRGKTLIGIYNPSGNKVMELRTDKTEDNLIRELSVDRLEQGVYTIKVIVNQKDISFTKLVITR
jgi:uncharacterized protein (TIGR02145 family)